MAARFLDMLSAKPPDFSVRAWGEVMPVSLLTLLLDEAESPLCSLLKPTRPSFSTTATKFVRTLESGRGESGVGVPVRDKFQVSQSDFYVNRAAQSLYQAGYIVVSLCSGIMYDYRMT